MIEALSVTDQTCWLVDVVTLSEPPSAGRFICASCDQVAACCGSYEDCISCCLRPEQRPGLQQILNKAAESNNVLFVSVSDHFELCLAKCRTSSSSVQHENTYRNKIKKFCYGKNP